MQHILGLHQPYYERSAPSLFEWLLDASAALADRRRHGRARADGREDLGAAGLFRYGGMDTADVGRLADLPRSGVSPEVVPIIRTAGRFSSHPPARDVKLGDT